jgi:hypothetical protein
MCDYSLHGVNSRPAKVNDRLVTTQFWNTTTSGFSEVGTPAIAVCLLPGTEVCFERDVERVPSGFQLMFFRKSKRAIPHKVARFRQVNMDNPCTHHDALEFPGGQIVLLTHLRPGQRATVLQLPVQQKQPVEAQPQTRVSHPG